MDAAEQKTMNDIAKYGCHVIYVLAEKDFPPFAYSVGIQRSSGCPEVVVIGLKHPLAHSIVNVYNNRIKAGERFVPGARYGEFIGGFEVTFEKVHRKHYEDYFGWNRWLYNGNEFDVVQLVYPTTQGIWPWDAEASDWFRSWQPLLTETGTPGFLSAPDS